MTKYRIKNEYIFYTNSIQQNETEKKLKRRTCKTWFEFFKKVPIYLS